MWSNSEADANETVAQPERLKPAENPWQALDEIRECARRWCDSVPPELGLYSRWRGIYSQGEGAGAVDGRRGEGKASPYFMGRVETVARELDAAGPPPFWRGAIACTGTEFRKLAITETKGYTRWLVDELGERVPGFDPQLKLNVTGCTNSCARRWIADIGLEGKRDNSPGPVPVSVGD